MIIIPVCNNLEHFQRLPSNINDWVKHPQTWISSVSSIWESHFLIFILCSWQLQKLNTLSFSNKHLSLCFSYLEEKDPGNDYSINASRTKSSEQFFMQCGDLTFLRTNATGILRSIVKIEIFSSFSYSPINLKMILYKVYAIHIPLRSAYDGIDKWITFEILLHSTNKPISLKAIWIFNKVLIVKFEKKNDIDTINSGETKTKSIIFFFV